MKFTIKGNVVLWRYFDTFKSGAVGGGTNAEFAKGRIAALIREGWTAEEDTADRLVLKRGRKQARHVIENVAE